jgi:chromosome segregation ATPase
LALENVLTVKQDVEKQLAMALEHNQQIDSAKDELNKELENASDYIVRLEDKFYEAKKTSLDLLKCVKDSEAEIDQLKDEIEMLKAYIIDLKSRIAVYIPVKGDAIDKKMAEYINNYPDRQKLKIMFMRESEGVYQFGTKRIGVKVAKDKIEIRVGGGFLSIDEFLDQYTPAELEKLERKDPIKRKSERLAVQKVLVGKEQRESSPI